MEDTKGKVTKLAQLIKNWVSSSSGWFTTLDLDKDLGIISPEGKGARRVNLHRLCAEGILKRHPDKNGFYRLITDIAPIVPWEEANIENTVDLSWPFELEKLVKIYPKNIIIIAGSFNAGKTAFCFDFIARNQFLYPIVYYTSEMGAEEMKVRLSKFPSGMEWNFEARERSSNFADVIQPDKINIIDYLEVTDNFYLVAEELSEIFVQLKKGIALIALQKKRGADMGRGAEFSLEKPRLYLSMDNNLLKIIKAKNWAVEGVNPNGRKFKFKLVQGCSFTNIEEIKGDTS